MLKHPLGLAIAILTFLAGLLAASLMPPHRPGHAEQAPSEISAAHSGGISQSPVAHSGGIPSAWKRVKISRRFSAYLPPGMEYSSPPQGGALYTGAGYRFYYDYGRRLSDRSCHDLSRVGPRPGKRVEVGRKLAWLDDAAGEDYSAMGAHDWPSMRLCVPDTGDGIKLFIEVQTIHSRRLNEARAMIDSIEFR